MNQFQILLNDCLIHTNHVESAAVLVAKSGRVTAVSSRFQANQSQEGESYRFLKDKTLPYGSTIELYLIIESLTNKTNSKLGEAQMFTDAFKHLTVTREQGFFFNDKAFTCVRADRNSIYCKCGDNGLILVKTALFVIVATYYESMYPSVCVEAVEKLAEYLREKGK